MANEFVTRKGLRILGINGSLDNDDYILLRRPEDGVVVTSSITLSDLQSGADFDKGSLIIEDGLFYSGSITDRLVGSGSLTIGILTGSNSGLSLSPTGIVLGTPGTITIGSTNSVTGESHTHALSITAEDLGADYHAGFGLNLDANRTFSVDPTEIVTITGSQSITGHKTFTTLSTFEQDIDVWGSANIEGDVVIGGDLLVNGTATYINTTDLYVKDKLITLASGSTSEAASSISGIEVQISAAGPHQSVNPRFVWVDNDGWTITGTDPNLIIDGTLDIGTISLANPGYILTIPEGGGEVTYTSTSSLLSNVPSSSIIKGGGMDITSAGGLIGRLLGTSSVTFSVDSGSILINDLQGPLSASNGGTGLTFIDIGHLIVGDGSNTYTTISTSSLLGSIGGVSSSLTLQITGSPNQIYTNPATAQNLSTNRTWTLSLPQDIHTSANVTFSLLTAQSGIYIQDGGGQSSDTDTEVMMKAKDRYTLTTSFTDIITLALRKAAWFDYYTYDGTTNSRTGTVMATTNAANTITYTDTSVDEGDTTVVEFQVITDGAGGLKLQGRATSGTWYVKVYARGI